MAFIGCACTASGQSAQNYAISYQAGTLTVSQAALAHCQKLGDRFAILDVKDGDVGKFRDGIGTDDLLFGAAYHPYVKTSMVHVYDETAVTIDAAAASPPASPSIRCSCTLRAKGQR